MAFLKIVGEMRVQRVGVGRQAAHVRTVTAGRCVDFRRFLLGPQNC